MQFAPVEDVDETQQIYFSIRGHDREDLDSWDVARRETFLLNTDAPPPYSLDPRVWPEFSHPLLPQLHGSEEYVSFGFTLHLQDPDSLVLHSFAGEKFTVSHVASVYSKALRELKTQTKLDLQLVVASANIEAINSLFPVSQTLGFDVTDSSFGAITNCGYAEEKEAIANQFANKLNDQHLFLSFADAAEFAEMSNNRIPEHAPFLVYCLKAIE